MATVVHEHTHETEKGGSTSLIVGIIVLLVLAVLFFMYVLPYFRAMSAPQITVPDKIDVNVNTQQK